MNVGIYRYAQLFLRSHRLGCALAAATVILNASQVSAQLVPISLTDRIYHSDYIVEGEVVQQLCLWNPSRTVIYTRSDLRVFKQFKGSINRTILSVITPGGQIENVRQVVSHSLSLQKGDIGLFMLGQEGSGPAHGSGATDVFSVYAGEQGLIRYNMKTGTASDPFATYPDIERSLYHSIEMGTGRPFLEISPLPHEKQHRFLGEEEVVINSIAPLIATAGTGEVLFISGSGFGNTQGSSQVWFVYADQPSAYYHNSGFQVISWSDNMISILIPDKAASGQIRILKDGIFTNSTQELSIKYAVMNSTNSLVNLVEKNGQGGITWNMAADFYDNAEARNRFIESVELWQCNILVNWLIGESIQNAGLDDQIYSIRWEDPDELPAGVLASTRSTFMGSDCGNGMFWHQFEADITVSTRFNWNAGTDLPQGGQYDLSTVLLHELGHASLFGHVNDPDDLMYYAISPGQTKRYLNGNNLLCGEFIMDYSSQSADCGYSPMQKLLLTENIPSRPSGNAEICQGATSSNYSTTACGGASTGLVWLLTPAGAGTIEGSGKNITIQWNNGFFGQAQLKVRYANAGANEFSEGLDIIVQPLPLAAGVISGNNTVCQGQSSVNYSVPAIANATSYVWTLPNGAAGASNTGNISVDFSPSASSGNITVKGTNACGQGDAATLAVSVNPLPATAGAISGSNTVCQGQSSVNYSVPAIANATSYTWTLPPGTSGESNTGSIILNFGESATSGNITVKGANACGQGNAATLAVSVNQLPAAAGAISGSNTVCQGQSSVNYSVPAIANATSYSWTLPNGAAGASNTGNISVDFSPSALSGSITVKGTNTCGQGITATLAVSVNPLPATAGAISGSNTVCQGQSSVGYSVAAIANATSYSWTLPSGAAGASSTGNISVDFSPSASSGNITVKGTNACGQGDAATLAVSVNLLPATAGAISGSNTVCQGQGSVNYSVPAIANAASYVWTLPNGAMGTSVTNNISVNFSPSASSGNITVKGSNACGEGPARSLPVTVNSVPAAAGPIAGSNTVCKGASAVNYSVPAIPGASSYVWILPNGVTGESSTSNISVNFSPSASSGNITVKGSNACGEGAARSLAVTVNSVPSAAGSISGSNTVCQGQSSVNYSVPAIANATSYVWTLPNGAEGASSTGNISVDFSPSASSGNITVKGTNACGQGDAATLAVSVNPLPATAGTISGSNTVCQGQSSVNYSVPAIANATSYSWTLPNGAAGASNTGNISVDFSPSASSGNITVKGTNACGQGNAATLAVSVNPLPAAAGAISGSNTVCQGQSSVNYTVPAIANATSYIWTLPSGTFGASNKRNISVSFGPTSASGSITVKGLNACGEGAARSLAVTVNSVPSAAGSISGSNTVCQGQSSVSYSVSAIPGATSYVWSLPPGALGYSDDRNISVDYGTSAKSGSITVKATNTCGEDKESILPISVFEKPPTPVIILTDNSLESDAAVGNQWFDRNGPIPGATGQSYVFTRSGNYYAIITISGCKSEPSNTIEVIITQLENEWNKITTTKIYPNPAANTLYMENRISDDPVDYRIIHLSGNILYSGKFAGNTTVDIGQLGNGIYLIAIDTDNGTEMWKIFKK